MKYIRTKDGIFEVVKEDGDWLEITSNFEREMQCHCVIKKHAVIKQSDTIEELCDEFVAVVNDNTQQHQFMKPFDYYMRSLNQKDVSLFGAIWTEWGLKYVAKMNEDGRLCLL